MKQSNYMKFIEEYNTKIKDLYDLRTETWNKIDAEERQMLLNQKELLDGEATFFPDGRIKSFTCFTAPSDIQKPTDRMMTYGGQSSLAIGIEQSKYWKAKIRIEVLDYGDNQTFDYNIGEY